MLELSNLIQELQLIQNGDAWHGPGLQKILDGITAAEAYLQPIAGSHSIAELVLHIAAWEDVFSDRLEGKIKNEPEEGDFPRITGTDDDSWQRTIQYLHAAHERLIRIASRLNDSDLSRIVPGKDFTIAFMLHGIVRHNVYHAGQIGLLKKKLI